MLIILLISNSCDEDRKKPKKNLDKKVEKRIVASSTQIYKGVNLEGPRQPFETEEFNEIIEINCNYVGVIPYAFLKRSTGEVHYNHPRQWWGESHVGIAKIIDIAKSKGLKVMMKPHVWVEGQGWAGDLVLKGKPLETWKKTYMEYIITYSKMSQEKNVSTLCIGTEFRHLVSHIDYWKQLIAKVREVYDGMLTYAANWDNYEKVKFWDQLDIIGIDAYFPLKQESEVLSRKILMKNAMALKSDLDEYAKSQNKQYLFTEYGFKYLKNTSSGHWLTDKGEIDESEQALCYDVFLDVFRPDVYFGGGFIWKWHLSGSAGHHGYFTPQGKQALSVIRSAYSEW